MNPIIAESLGQLAAICTRRRVRRLALFGSATSDEFDLASSDLDFVVEFEPMLPADHADQYFGLMEDLLEVFGLPVDLVERGPIRNPYFRRVIEETQELLFEAA